MIEGWIVLDSWIWKWQKTLMDEEKFWNLLKVLVILMILKFRSGINWNVHNKFSVFVKLFFSSFLKFYFYLQLLLFIYSKTEVYIYRKVLLACAFCIIQRLFLTNLIWFSFVAFDTFQHTVNPPNSRLPNLLSSLFDDFYL